MLGIVICHKNLARELLNTATAIVGHADNLFAFSNHTKSTEQLLQDLTDFLNRQGNPPEVLFMVDLRGGNCWTVARMLIRENSGYYVLSGVNLPMLISFLTKKDRYSFGELIKVIENDSCRNTILEQ